MIRSYPEELKRLHLVLTIIYALLVIACVFYHFVYSHNSTRVFIKDDYVYRTEIYYIARKKGIDIGLYPYELESIIKKDFKLQIMPLSDTKAIYLFNSEKLGIFLIEELLRLLQKVSFESSEAYRILELRSTMLKYFANSAFTLECKNSKCTIDDVSITDERFVAIRKFMVFVLDAERIQIPESD